MRIGGVIFRSFIAFVALVGGGLWLGPTQAQAQSQVRPKSLCLRSHVLKLKKEEVPDFLKASALTPMDVRRIQGVFSRERLSPQERLGKAFSIYIEARLRSVNPRQAAAIRERLVSLKATASQDGKFVATGAKIQVPEDLLDTALKFGVVAHEFEHNIQFAEIASPTLFGNLKVAAQILFVPNTRYVLEYGAMKAEWEFLHHVPERYRLEAVRKLDSIRDPRTREALRQMLLTAHLDQDAYLRNQHKLGRYSYGQNLYLASAHSAAVIPVVYVLYLLGEAGYKASCSQCGPGGVSLCRSVCE